MHANIQSTRRTGCVSRHERSGQTSSRLRYKHLAFGVGLALGSLLVCTTATAASGVAAAQSPIGGRVVGGAGSIVQRGANTIVNQQSKLLALDWQSFNVGKDASVLFKQPGKSAIALNRILDQNPSQIFGKIASNGQIFLINTHGIIFGSSAQLNVGGLVASTLDLTPQDFLKKHFDLDAHGGHAGVVNHGTIAAASGGSVSLIGGHVENDGVIVADYGHINLDGADKAVLDFDGNGLINVEITGALQKRLDADEQAVANKGTLQAAGGTVVLQASAAKNLFTDLVNNSGVIKAGGISTAGGVVRLVGSGGNTISSGTIDVSGTRGGSVQLLSDQHVGVTGGSINASGVNGGGSIRVGGGWQGGEGLPTASATYVAPDAVLNADAIQSGNGGSVVVWGNHVNNFYGSIFARGGALGGNGGQVETSAHDGLNVQGAVDASAPFGLAGTWLLDPHDVEITGSAGALSGTAPDQYFSAATDTSQISASAINTALTGGSNVSIFTGSSGTTQPGDITISDPITAAGSGSLYLMAAGSILVNKDISGKGAGNPLNVYLWANYAGATPGGSTYAYSGGTCTTCTVVIGNTGSANVNTYGGDLDIETGSSTGGVAFGTSSTVIGNVNTGAGKLTVNTGGAIVESENSGLVAGGASSFTTGDAAITLDATGNINNLSGTVKLTNTGANDVALDNGSNALMLGDVSVGSGTLTISAKGIQQATSSAVTQTASAGNATFKAGAGALDLGNTGNDFTGVVSLNNSGANNVTLDNGGNALTLGSVGVGSGTLDVTDYGSGALTLTGNIITAGSAITFANAVTLDAAAIIIDTSGSGATGANITFDKTVDGTSAGSNALTLKAGTTGAVTFGGAVGGVTNGALKSLTTTANSIVLNNAGVTTTGVQTYDGPVVVNNDTTLTTANGAVAFNDAVDSSGSAAKSLTVASGSGAVTFGDAVGSAPSGVLGALKVTGTGTTTFGSTVKAASVATSSGTNTLDGNVTTTGTQTYKGAVLLGSGVTLKTTNSDVTFDSTVDNAVSGTSEALTVAAGTGNVSFGGAVGGGSNGGLGALDVSGTGSSTLKGDVTTSGSTVAFGGAVVVAGSSVQVDTTGGSTVPAGANINFQGKLDGDTAGSNALVLKVGTDGGVTFGNAVGGTTELDSLEVTAGSGGNGILLTGGSVQTANAQTYNGAVVLNNDATFTTTDSAVDFNGTVDSAGSAGKSLTVASGSGAVTFDDAVGSASGGVLGALKITGTGATTFGGIVQASSVATSSGTTTLSGDVTTSGAQTYNGAVLLNGSGDSVKLTTTGGNVDFTGAVDNKTSGTPEALTIAAGTGDVTFGGAVGGTNGALAGLDITGTGATTLKGDVTTSGDQTYTGAVLLDDSAGDNSLTLTGGNISFNSTLGNAASLATHQALEVDVGSAGVATFTGAVGSSADPLGALTLDAGGYALFSGTVDADSLTAKLDTRLHGDVTTHGAQDYEKTLDVFSPALTLTSNNHDITLNDVSNQTTAMALTVDAGSGSVAFNGDVCSGTATCGNALGLDVTATGGITEGTSGVIKASASSFDAGTGGITLTNTGNDFSGAVTLTGGATQVTTAGALALGKVNVGSLVGKASGAISQSTVAADAVTVSGTSSFTTGGYTIDLGNTSNNFGGAVSLTNSGPNAVTLDNGSHALTLGDVNVGSGTLAVTGAGISQVTGTTIKQASGAGAATFDAGTSNALTLGNSGNDFTGAVAATGAGISIEDTNDLDIASVSEPINHDLSLIAGGTLTMPTGAFDTGTGAITLESGTGGLSAPALTGGDITVSANGGVLTTDNVSGADIALTGKDGITLNGNVTASGTLGLASTDAAITQQSGTITTCATSCTTTVNSGTGASAGTIDLTEIGNVFSSPVNLTGGATNIATSGPIALGTLATGALTITSTGALSLGTGTVGGALQATSNNGDITQNTASGDSLTVNGAATLDAGTGSIVLANSGNDFKDLVYAFGTGVSIQDANDLEIGGLTNNNGAVSLVAGGNLTGVGSIDAGTGNITLAANGGALTTGALSGNNVSLTGADGITLGDTVTANGGTLTLNSGTTISQDAGAVITADTLTGTSTGATTLDQANTITTLGAFTADGFSLTNGSALTVANGATVDGETGGTSLTVNTGNLTIDGTVGNTGGTTSLTASNGAINEATGGIVAATTLTGLSNGDTVLVGANRIATLGNFNADDFTLVNHAALNVTGPLLTTGNINLTTTGTGNVLSVGQALTGGMITLASAGDLSVEQGIQASTINLTANGNLAIDALVDSGSGATTLTQNGSAGAITEGAHGVITADTLTGAAQGGVVLDKANAVSNLGDFTAANGFKLTNGQKLIVAAGHTVDGGASTALATTGAGSDLQIDGNVKGTVVDLSSSSDVGEGNHGVVTAGVLTGNVAHAANLTGANAVAGLGDFTANGLTLNSAGPLTVVAGATADGGANTTLTTTGATGNLVINGTLKGATTTLNVGGAASEGANGVVSAGTLTGSSVGSTSLTGRNDVANLDDFSADGFALTTDPGLTVVDGATVEGRSGVALTTTGAGNAINIDGTVTGIRVNLTSSGAIAEGSNGMVQAGELTGSSAGDTKLTQTEISALDAFNAKNFSLTDAHALSVGGPLTTTGNAGDISLTTTGGGNALTINQAVRGAAIKLTSASDLTIANAVTGTNVALASNGNLAINAAVSSGTGTTTLTQAGSGAISGGANGAITAATFTGSASGVTTLGSDGQFMGNHVGVLGGFSSPAGFSLTNDGTLTLASVGGSAYTVDAGKSKLYLEVHDGDLLQNGSNWLYDGTGSWYATGHIGLANAPIYVTGVADQAVKFIGLPPAYFYAVDYEGNLLPLTGASSVNVPTSVLSSRSQGINGHTDHYIDISVITANYRGYGVVPPGVLLPPDQWDCAPDQPSPELCPKGN